MNDVFNPRFRYKNGLTDEDQALIRQLRCRGYAVAIIPPVEVGAPFNRSPAEQAMVRAGRKLLKIREVRAR